IGGVRCLRSGPGDTTASAPLVVYLHGGGYALGSPEVAVPITERLASQVEVVSVDYRLAPEHPYPAALEDTLAVLDALATGPDAARGVVLAGDSAGANLALSAALALTRRAGTDTRPSARLSGLILLSPHLDHRPRHRQDSGDRRDDVDNEAGRWLSAAYRGIRSIDDPAVSPLLADPEELGSLPPVLIQVGTIDSTFQDAVRFARAARTAGCQTTLDVWDGLWHTWHYHRDLPEADAALLEAAQFAIAPGR
ncbi:MAG: alpha/beta hydrolase fold domain-containing protein, partial [Actinomycetota bacterium]|nr:alpha/beta hydrolase fold domain-containing protein [Actinomycetota bacterium]